jgi:hypothetical protein
MVNLFNSIKALIVCALTTGIYTLYTSTSSFQDQLAREGQEVGKIEALMHYSSLMDVWSRMLYGWLHLFVICFISCYLLMFWLKPPIKARHSIT